MPLKHSKDPKRLKTELKKFIDQDAPRIVGVEAKNFFKANFKKQGFDDIPKKKWDPRKTKDKNERSNRALLIKTGRLRRSIQYKVIRKRKVQVFSSDVPYAEIHNEGGTIKGRQSVRSHSRRTARGSSAVKSFQREVNITIPKRQFMGNSKKLDALLQRELTRRIKRILK